MFSQASKGLCCKALENAVRLLYHKSKQTTFAGARQCPALPQQGLLMVQCSPLREATLFAHRATARFGAYHRAAYGGYYTTKRHTQRAAYLSPERLRPFRGGSMFSQPSEILDFRLRREVIIPQGARSAALLSPEWL